MKYENMRVPELKALARDRGLRNYSRMRKAELVALLRELLGGGLRTPTQQQMDIFKQQEMNRSQP